MVPQTIFGDDDLVMIDEFTAPPKIHPLTSSSTRTTGTMPTEKSNQPADDTFKEGTFDESQTPKSKLLPLRSHAILSSMPEAHSPQEEAQAQRNTPEHKADKCSDEDMGSSFKEVLDSKKVSNVNSNVSGEQSSNVSSQTCGGCHHDFEDKSRGRSIPIISSYAPPLPPLPMSIHKFPPGPFPPGLAPPPFNPKPKKTKFGKRYLAPPPPPPPFSPGGPLAPPPPPPMPYGVFGSSQSDSILVKSYADLIPTEYTNDIKPEDRLVRTSFNKDIYTYYHTAGLYDLEKYAPMLRAADPETWYQYPSTSDSAYMTNLLESGQLEDALDYLSPDINGRRICPLTSITPQIWASAALTAPIDDDVRNCSAGHHDSGPRRPSLDNICDDCTMIAARKLRNTSLVYHSVQSTYHDSNAYSVPLNPGQNPMYRVFKIAKFGNRESAAAEAFYAAGKEGWSTAFSCVMRADAQGAFARGARVVRVEKLSELGGEDIQESAGLKVRVFF